MEVSFCRSTAMLFQQTFRVLLTADDDDCATRAEKYDSDSLNKQIRRTAPVSEELGRRLII